MANRRLSGWARLWIVAALAIGGATACASLQANPGQPELRLARYEWLSRHLANTNVVSGDCAIVSHVACHQIVHSPPTYWCTYRELQTHGDWRRKVGIISPDDQTQWKWVTGDPPFCAVTELPGPG